jgi:hypothetical protein
MDPCSRQFPKINVVGASARAPSGYCMIDVQDFKDSDMQMPTMSALTIRCAIA